MRIVINVVRRTTDLGQGEGRVTRWVAQFRSFRAAGETPKQALVNLFRAIREDEISDN